MLGLPRFSWFVSRLAEVGERVRRWAEKIMGPNGRAPIARVAALAVPFLSVGLGVASGLLGWFGPSIQDLSNQENAAVLIQPTDGAFSIWGAIYPGVLALAALQFFRPNGRLERARAPLVVNMLLNFVWFVVTQNRLEAASLAVLVGQFVTALWLYFALEIPSTSVGGVERFSRGSVSLYAGWLTVATVVSVAGLLSASGFSGWGLSAVAWTVLMLIACAAIGLVAAFAWGDAVYGAVFVWAFAGVAVKAGQPSEVILTASVLAGIAALALPLVVRTGRSRRRSALRA